MQKSPENVSQSDPKSIQNRGNRIQGVPQNGDQKEDEKKGSALFRAILEERGLQDGVPNPTQINMKIN